MQVVWTAKFAIPLLFSLLLSKTNQNINLITTRLKFQSEEVVNCAVITRQCEGNDLANDKKDKVRRAAGFFWTDT